MRQYRVYYNKASEKPHVFSVDEGSHASEVCFQAVEIMVPCRMVFDEKAEYPEPKCWAACSGELHVSGGKATIYRTIHEQWVP